MEKQLLTDGIRTMHIQQISRVHIETHSFLMDQMNVVLL